MKKIVIFDLDGTLLDTLTDLTNAVNKALYYKNLPERQMEDIRRFVGNGAKKLMERASDGLLSDEEEQALLELFLRIYQKEQQKNTKPYNGIMPMLSALKARKIPLMVCSNKPHEATKALVDYYFQGFFLDAYGASSDIPQKPAPDMINRILEKYGVAPHEVLYIGDSEVDVLTAGNANVELLACSWGFRDKEFLLETGAQKIIQAPEEILAHLFTGEVYE